MGKAKKGEQKDVVDAELEALMLEAEPDREFDDFHNDLPAFLLAKVSWRHSSALALSYTRARAHTHAHAH